MPPSPQCPRCMSQDTIRRMCQRQDHIHWTCRACGNQWGGEVRAIGLNGGREVPKPEGKEQ
jgi:ribosomal protein L37AE/L43A